MDVRGLNIATPNLFKLHTLVHKPHVSTVVVSHLPMDATTLLSTTAAQLSASVRAFHPTSQYTVAELPST